MAFSRGKVYCAVIHHVVYIPGTSYLGYAQGLGCFMGPGVRYEGDPVFCLFSESRRDS